MKEQIRYESAERVRDFYREQGRKQERERIIDLVCRYSRDDLTAYKVEPELEIYLAAIANGALSSGHDYGAQDERNRIIKLLEDAQITTVEIPDPVTFEPKEIKVRCEAVRADLLIALIKGESQNDNKSVVILTEGETDA